MQVHLIHLARVQSVNGLIGENSAIPAPSVKIVCNIDREPQVGGP